MAEKFDFKQFLRGYIFTLSFKNYDDADSGVSNHTIFTMIVDAIVEKMNLVYKEIYVTENDFFGYTILPSFTEYNVSDIYLTYDDNKIKYINEEYFQNLVRETMAYYGIKVGE